MGKCLKFVAVVAFVSFLTVGASGCSNKYKEQVVGTWEWKVDGVPLTVVINKDGTGTVGAMGVTVMNLTWRIQKGNNFVFNDGKKDSGFLIKSADENTITGTDPEHPDKPIVWTRKK